MFEDYYSVLQVHPEAEPEIIQSAYKRLCKKYHPDVSGAPQATERIKRINTAYETLGDEAKRRVYHAEWSRRAVRAPALKADAAPRVEVRERVVYVRPEPVRYGGGTRGAFQVISDYFGHLAARRLREAYALISEADRGNFTYGSYVEWQESVSALYEIGSVRPKLFKSHPQFKIGEKTRAEAEEYAVTITEKTLETGTVSEYTLNKYAVLEPPPGLSRPPGRTELYDGWRVYLGYRDLTPLMLRFRTVVNPTEAQFIGVWERFKESNDLTTGLLNGSGFEERVEAEDYRYRRYHRPYTLAVLRLNFPRERIVDGAHRELVVRYVGYIIGKSIRPIDQLAFLDGGAFGVLLAEARRDTAAKAVRRILDTVRHDIAACFDFEVDIRAAFLECDGRQPKELIRACLDAAGAFSGQFGGAFSQAN
ncbi:MAG: DnaJ domain-containing protein [Oscillospiraceae bacterium]|nr:DnaJ domain-containing protein [Oscillospiraceae bacterium]